MFPVKHTVIYTFFAITSVQNTCFCSVFNALASKNPAKSCYVQCFFHFWPFFHCRKATKMTQNSISIPSCAQTPKNPRKMSKTPPYSGLGAKPFLGPPPPAKADIATAAILTNVIEHLVLLFCPPISTPSPPKRCGRIYTSIFWVPLRWANQRCGKRLSKELSANGGMSISMFNLLQGNLRNEEWMVDRFNLLLFSFFLISFCIFRVSFVWWCIVSVVFTGRNI